MSVITATTDVRLRAPEGLSSAEVDLWLDTIRLVPASFFPPEASEQLAAYCRHAVSARDISRLLSKFSPKWLAAEGGLERLDRLLKMRDRESRAMLAAARALRLTNQSRYDAKTAHRKSGGAGSFYDTFDLMDDDND